VSRADVAEQRECERQGGAAAVATHGLCKSFASRTVLADLNLRVPAGSLFGFLGPNGAGKTTTIRLLLGLLRPTRGTALVLGCDAWRDGPRVRRQVGYLPGDIRFYDRMTGAALLGFLGAARGGSCESEVRRLARVLDLDLSRRIRTYSRGMKQRLGLIQALMHRPQLVVLDEPTVALDPLMRQALYDELRRVVADGRTVLFSSHTLSEVEALCDEVAILRDGRLVEQERIEVLRTRAVRRVEVLLDGPAPAASELPTGLRADPVQDGRLLGTWVGPVDRLLSWLAGRRVLDMTIAPPDLEDLFLAYYSPSGEDGAT
jgi:ABC-2 type transport system ATP-binding protein